MKTTRIIAAALSVCMLGGAVGYDSPLFEGVYVTADAAKQKYENVSGTCGESLTWTLDRNTGVLSVEGTGKMTSAPWSIYYDTPYTEEIRRVVLPEGLINVYYGAFSECSNLTEINIPESVTSIEGMAFGKCSSLTEINIPEGVTSIGDFAFSGCSGLTSIMIPSNCEVIGMAALEGCTELQEVTIKNPYINIEITRVQVSYYPEKYYENLHWCMSNNQIEIESLDSFGDKKVTNIPEFTGTIYGYSGSTAEAFAKDYCNFVAIDSASTKGDLNNDTMIDGRDATLVLAMYADSSSSGYVPTDADRAVGDVNSDTFIDGRDATIILGYYADLSAGASISFENYLKENNYV